MHNAECSGGAHTDSLQVLPATSGISCSVLPGASCTTRMSCKGAVRIRVLPHMHVAGSRPHCNSETIPCQHHAVQVLRCLCTFACILQMRSAPGCPAAARCSLAPCQADAAPMPPARCPWPWPWGSLGLVPAPNRRCRRRRRCGRRVLPPSLQHLRWRALRYGRHAFNTVRLPRPGALPFQPSAPLS